MDLVQLTSTVCSYMYLSGVRTVAAMTVTLFCGSFFFFFSMIAMLYMYR